jgi:hypothetical protein
MSAWSPPEGHASTGMDGAISSLVHSRQGQISATQLPHLCRLEPNIRPLIGRVVGLGPLDPPLLEALRGLLPMPACDAIFACDRASSRLLTDMAMNTCRVEHARGGRGSPVRRRRRRSRTYNGRRTGTAQHRGPSRPAGMGSTSPLCGRCRARHQLEPNQGSPSVPHSSPCSQARPLASAYLLWHHAMRPLVRTIAATPCIVHVLGADYGIRELHGTPVHWDKGVTHLLILSQLLLRLLG